MYPLTPLEDIRANVGLSFVELIEAYERGRITDEVAIRWLYLTILNRAPSTSELATYEERLDEVDNLVIVATEFVMNSREEIYRRIRGR